MTSFLFWQNYHRAITIIDGSGEGSGGISSFKTFCKGTHFYDSKLMMKNLQLHLLIVFIDNVFSLFVASGWREGLEASYYHKTNSARNSGYFLKKFILKIWQDITCRRLNIFSICYAVSPNASSLHFWWKLFHICLFLVKKY